MTKITSHNSRPDGLARQLFLPDLAQISLYILSSILILALGNINAFWDYLNHDPIGQQKAANIFIGEGGNGGFLNNITQNRLSQVIFWILVGSVIYAVIWFLKNIVTNLHNDVIADEFVHPKAYNRAKYWESVISRKLLFTFICVVLIGFLYAAIKLLPSLSGIFFSAIYNFKFSNLGDIAEAVLILAFLLHILVVLTRLTANSWRFIHADL